MSVSPLRLRLVLATLLAAALLGAAAAPIGAQSLRGSRASVQRAYDRARGRGLAFRQTNSGIRRAAARGTYVWLSSGGAYRLQGVTMPYVLPTTRAVLATLGARYRKACGERMVVTSAMRPASRRLANGSPLSVHPTGMAVDLRAPGGRCRGWLREALIGLERSGTLDATEERRPAHFHLVVYGAARRAPAARRSLAAAPATARRAYGR